jgi:hypothetical protein
METETRTDLAPWLTKSQAAHYLNSSEKHIERLAKRGRVQQAMRRQDGARTMAVFNPRDIERERARQTTVFEVQPFVEAGGGALAKIDKSDAVSPVSQRDVFAEVLAHIANVVEAQNNWNARSVYVSLATAARLTGLTRGTVLRLTGEGKVATMPYRRGVRYRRADLEAL